MKKRLNHEHLPLETLLSTREHEFQRAFAYHALDLLGDASNGVAYEPESDGLHIYAADETAMARAMELVQWHFPRHVELQCPQVRYRMGETLEEPIMDVTMTVPGQWLLAAQEELAPRDFELLHSGVVPGNFLIQGQAPLRGLIGFAPRLAQITRGKAALSMTLSHYSPLHREPDLQEKRSSTSA